MSYDVSIGDFTVALCVVFQVGEVFFWILTGNALAHHHFGVVVEAFFMAIALRLACFGFKSK